MNGFRLPRELSLFLAVAELLASSTLAADFISLCETGTPQAVAAAIAAGADINAPKPARMGLGMDSASLRDDKELQAASTLKDGVIVRKVYPGLPAASSGLQPADVIIAVDGVAVATSFELREQLTGKAVGQKIRLSVMRSDNRLEVSLQTAELPEDDKGLSPLLIAAKRNQNPEVIAALLKAGADIKAKDAKGRTALELAARFNGSSAVTLWLLSEDLKVDFKDLRAAVRPPPFAPSQEERAILAAGLGWARRGTEEGYRRAVEEFDRVTYSSSSKWPELQYNLGLVCQKLNQFEKARDSFSQYLTLDPQASDAIAVRDQIARSDVELEKERRRLKLQGAWNSGGNVFYPAINLYLDGTNITAGVFVQGEAFQGTLGRNARWDRVPVTMDRGQLTLRYDHKIVPSTSPSTQNEPYWKFYRSSYPILFVLRQVTPRTLEGMHVWGNAAPSRIIIHKVSDTPAENLADIGKDLPDTPWTDGRLSWGLTREVMARNHLIEGIAAVETADTPADYEMAVLYFEKACSWLRDWPPPHYNLALTAEMLGTKSHYTNALAHLDQYLALPVTAQEKAEAQAVRERIAGKLAQLGDRQTLAGIWVPKISNSSHDEPRLEIRRGATVDFQARALGGLNTQHIMVMGPWVSLTGEPDLLVQNARYYTQHKDAAPDCGPVNVTFNLTRIAEDKLEGTVVMTYVGSDERRRGDVTRTYVFERETPAAPTPASPADQRRLLRRSR